MTRPLWPAEGLNFTEFEPLESLYCDIYISKPRTTFLSLAIHPQRVCANYQTAQTRICTKQSLK